jgi:peroxiredoxin
MMLILKSEFVAQNMLGKPAPPIEGVDISGIKISLSKLRGKVVLVTFFTTRNASILRFLPRLNNMYDEYLPKRLEMVGICIDTNPDGINPFVARNKILWPVLHDANGSTQKSYYVIRDPKCFIINRDGTLASQGLEGIPLEKEIRRLLELEA